MRRLTLLGYVLVALLLAAFVFCELRRAQLPQVSFHDGTRWVRTSAPAVAAASLAFALGWAYLLAALGASSLATRGGILLLFLVEWGTLATDLAGPGLGALAAALLAAVAAEIILRRAGRGKDALLRFGIWLVPGVVVAGWMLAARRPASIAGLDACLAVLFMVVWPFFILLGLGAVDGGAGLARAAAVLARKHLPEGWVRRLPLALLSFWGLFYAADHLAPGSALVETLGLATLASALLLLASAAFWIGRRWSMRSALLVLALAIAFVPISLALTLALRREQALQAGTAPVLLFAVMLVYNCLTFGPRFANGESAAMTRSGRVLTYFGLVLLVLAYAQLRLNTSLVTTGAPDTEPQGIVNALFFVGAVIVGLPYLGWIAVRRPERLIGEGTPTAPRGGSVPRAEHRDAGGASREKTDQK
ncbi:MAG TPA: hypothetical protein VFU47_08115 [Armatimonadota bacterium]|nr:hypothetical protein [Armatimonadota bacterium]